MLKTAFLLHASNLSIPYVRGETILTKANLYTLAEVVQGCSDNELF